MKCRQLILSAITLSCFTSVYASDVYRLDKDHCYIIWSVSHFGFSMVSGKFMCQGTLNFDAANPANSSLDVTIDTSKVNTGIAKLDEILQGKNFFDSANYPMATFKSTRIIVTGKEAGQITGVVTIHGVSKDITLNVKLNKQGQHPFFNASAFGFSGSATLKRSDFNMRGYLPGVSDDTQLQLQVEAIKAANNTP